MPSVTDIYHTVNGNASSGGLLSQKGHLKQPFWKFSQPPHQSQKTFYSKLWAQIISEHMKNKNVILSLIFITWKIEMLGRSPFDLPPQLAILEMFME